MHSYQGWSTKTKTTAPRKIILVRHGESYANRDRTLTGQTDPDLTSLGRGQARRASRYITRRFSPVDVIFASPLSRAVLTAEPVARKARTPVLKDERLLETDFGAWEGLNKSELHGKPGWNFYMEDPFHFRFPDGESPQDVKRRVLAFKETLRSDREWRTAVVVAHYTPIVFFLLSAMGNGDAKSAPFRIDNASLSVIELGEDYELVTLLNFSP